MIASAAALRLGHIAVTRSSAIGDKLLLDETDQQMCNGRTVKADRDRTGTLRVGVNGDNCAFPNEKCCCPRSIIQ